MYKSHSAGSKKPSSVTRTHAVYAVKDGHQYAFQFVEGCELNLTAALLSTALDPHYNLDLEDVRKMMEHLGISNPAASNPEPA